MRRHVALAVVEPERFRGLSVSSWARTIAEDPHHSTWYVERMRGLAAKDDDLAGEARFVAALVPPGSRVLDAGCGPGRVSGALKRLGLEPVGIDLDPVLLAAAREDWPGIRFEQGDLGALDAGFLDSLGEPFDAVVCAGNVLPFMEDGTQGAAFAALFAATREGGRLAVGFGTERGYSLEAFLTDAQRAGWRRDALFSTWQIHPRDDDSDFVVGIFTRAA